MPMIILKTISANQTKLIAGLLAHEIFKSKIKSNNALIFALSGNLGAGKTTFVQGFMKAAGIKKKITSPTFVIFKRFKIQDSRFKDIYHIDCYRVKKAKELLNLGIKEILKNPQNIVLIEWPEIIKRCLPKNTIQIAFKHGEKENERKVFISKCKNQRLK